MLLHTPNIIVFQVEFYMTIIYRINTPRYKGLHLRCGKRNISIPILYLQVYSMH